MITQDSVTVEEAQLDPAEPVRFFVRVLGKTVHWSFDRGDADELASNLRFALAPPTAHDVAAANAAKAMTRKMDAEFLGIHDDLLIAVRARHWLAAEADRKVRRREYKLAWLLVSKSGVEFIADPEDDFEGTQEQRQALATARQATAAYHAAARKAGAARGALTRLVALPAPVQNAAVVEAYEALCLRERQERLLEEGRGPAGDFIGGFDPEKRA